MQLELSAAAHSVTAAGLIQKSRQEAEISDSAGGCGQLQSEPDRAQGMCRGHAVSAFLYMLRQGWRQLTTKQPRRHFPCVIALMLLTNSAALICRLISHMPPSTCSSSRGFSDITIDSQCIIMRSSIKNNSDTVRC